MSFPELSTVVDDFMPRKTVARVGNDFMPASR
jgi:hypothetical protein